MLKCPLERWGIGLQQASAGKGGYRNAYLEQLPAITLDYKMPGGKDDEEPTDNT
jgi:hypothetical protein